MDAERMVVTRGCFDNEWINLRKGGNSMSGTEMVNDTFDIDDINIHEVFVYIADDNMSASVRLGRCEDGYTYDEVIHMLSQNGIKTGIDEEKIRWMISRKIYNKPVEVAFGKPVEAGKDGYYEFFFDTDTINNNRPTVREDGSVDYFNQKRFEKVNEGDLLARYHEPTKGEFGFDVCGKLLVPKPGKPKPRLHGKGFKTSEDGKETYAAISGKIEYCNYDLSVVNVYEVNGNLDMSMGNIDFNGDVNITGSVRSGVTVHAMGSIYVGGFVEGATLIAGKDIVLKDGVNTKNSGKIEAGGNISGRFFENTEVIAKGDLQCNYILNCRVLAYGRVFVEGPIGSIIGGDVTGVMGISTTSCGHESNVKTLLRVGSTKEIRKEYAELIMELKEVDGQIETFEIANKKFEMVKQNMPEKYDSKMALRVTQSKIVKMAQKAKLEEKSKALYNLIRDSERAVVKVKNHIYPGSRVYMDDKTYMPSSVFSHIIVKKTPSTIILRDYDE